MTASKPTGWVWRGKRRTPDGRRLALARDRAPAKRRRRRRLTITASAYALVVKAARRAGVSICVLADVLIAEALRRERRRVKPDVSTITPPPGRYSPEAVVYDEADTMTARIVALVPYDGRYLRRGEAIAIAAQIGDGCTPHQVTQVAYYVRRGGYTKPNGGGVGLGRALPSPPGSLPDRLATLDAEHPGLTRRQQANLLGTSEGMIRDTVWRLRKRGVAISGREEHEMRRDVAC